MRILELHVQGFRSLRDVTWRPGDLNIIIGPNGTGKSNLLRVIEMASVSAQARLAEHVQRSGGMETLVWDGSAEEITLSAVTAVAGMREQQNGSFQEYGLSLARIGQSGDYRIAEEILRDCSDGRSGGAATGMMVLDRQGTNYHIFDTPYGMSMSDYMPVSETLLSQTTGFLEESRFLADYRSQLATWSVYQVLRVDQGAPLRAPVVTRMEKRVTPDGQNLVNVLHTLYTGDREFKNDVNRAMRAAFGDEFEELVFPPAADQRVQLRIRWKSLKREQSAADLSDGTLRFLFLLAVLASPAAAPLIAIDEPETGLHPSMFPIIAEYAADAARRSQVILTTHSPAMLDAFKDTLPTTTVALWENGQTVLKTIEGGVLEEWVKNYSLGKLFTSGELEQLAAGTL